MKQTEIVEDGNKHLVDGDCTNNQIDLEECIIRSNRYYPCAPPERDAKKFRELFVERSKTFAKILTSSGYRLSPANLQFEFGDLPSFEIMNYDDKFQDQVRSFLKSLPEEELAEPYECFKKDFISLKKSVPRNSLRFFKFEKVLSTAACRSEIPDNKDILTSLNTKITTMKKKLRDSQAELESIQKTIPLFIEKIPKQIPDTCSENHRMHVENKIKVMETFKWECKDV